MPMIVTLRKRILSLEAINPKPIWRPATAGGDVSAHASFAASRGGSEGVLRRQFGLAAVSVVPPDDRCDPLNAVVDHVAH